MTEETQVKIYKGSNEYQKDAGKMAKDGWRVVSVVNEPVNPGVGAVLMFGALALAKKRSRTVVTYARVTEQAREQGVANTRDTNLAIASGDQRKDPLCADSPSPESVPVTVPLGPSGPPVIDATRSYRCPRRSRPESSLGCTSWS